MIYYGEIVTGYGRDVLDVINYNGKRFLSQLVATLKLPCYKGYAMQMAMYSTTHKADAILA